MSPASQALMMIVAILSILGHVTVEEWSAEQGWYPHAPFAWLGSAIVLDPGTGVG
jgi:hypothetical protein